MHQRRCKQLKPEKKSLTLLIKFKPLVTSALFLLLLLGCRLSTALAAEPVKAGLHRVDMVVSGSSCAACLIRLEKKLRAEKGVLKVVVSIYKPYKAVVIYDQHATNWPAINKVLESEKVTATDFKDSIISDIPLVLQPK